LDKEQSTVPDEKSQGPSRSKSYPNQPDGVWHFHIRAQDNAGYWGDTAHYGSIKLDTEVPITAMSSSDPDGENGWYISPVEITLSGKDSLSGVEFTKYQLNDDAWQNYSKPFTLSQDGEHTIKYYSKDNASNEEAAKTKPIKLDGIPPTTTLTLSGARGNNDWYVSSVEVTLSTEDALSDVGVTKYRINNGDWQNYSEPITLNEDGQHTIEYYSKDKAGNQETNKSKSIKIDTKLPTTTVAFSGTKGNDDWHVSSVEVTLSPEDASSGVEVTKYRINKGGWEDYSEPITLKEDGEYTIEFYSKDKAGNQEVAKREGAKLDATPPVTTSDISGTEGENGWYTSPVEITLSVEEDTSGVAITRYRLNEDKWQDSKTVVIDEDGRYIVNWYSEDKAGNQEDIKLEQINVDTTAPEFSQWTHEPDELTVNTQNGLTIRMKVDDALSGISDVQLDYKIDGDYDGYENMSKDGDLWAFQIAKDWSKFVGKTVYYKAKAVDEAGNNTESEEKYLSIGTAPQIEITTQFSQWESRKIKLEVSVEDDDDNLKKVFYKYSLDNLYWEDIGEASEEPYGIDWDTSSISCDDSVWIRAIAEDATNLRGEDTSGSFGVDNEIPTTQHDYDGEWHKPPFTITLTCDDGIGSGVAEVLYNLNGGEEQSGTAVEIKTEGVHELEYWSSDKLGNEEAHKPLSEIKIDATPPKTTISLSGTKGDDDWYISTVKVTLSAEDSRSGADVTKYRLNGSDWQEYSEPFAVDSEGVYTVKFYSIDRVDNQEEMQSESFKIDTQPPTASISKSGDKGENDWYVSDVTVDCNASDTMSGIKECRIKVDNGSWQTPSVTISDDGEHTVTFYAMDKAGNKSREQSEKIKLDKNSPEFDNWTHTPTKLSVETEGDFTIRVTIRDAVSGVSGIPQLNYKITGDYAGYEDMSKDGEDDWIFKIQEDWKGLSEKTIAYKIKASDSAGNETESEERYVIAGQAKISVSPDLIDFRTVRVNETAKEELTISNIGSAELRVTNIHQSGTDITHAKNITISETQFTIQPGKEHSIAISFTPSSVYKFGVFLTIESNAPDSLTIVPLACKFPKPEITDIEPISGEPEGDTEIVITGSNFAAGAIFEIGGKPVEAQVQSSTQIAAKTPAGSAGEKVDVIVTNPDSQQAKLEDGFTYKKKANLMLMVSPESVAYKGSEVRVDIKLDIGNAELARQQKLIIIYKKPSGQEIKQEATPKESGSNTHTATLEADRIDEVGTWTATAHWDGNDEYLPVDRSGIFEVTKALGEVHWTLQSKQVPIDTPVSLAGTLVMNIEGEIVTLEFTAPDGIIKEFTVKTEPDGSFKKEYTFDSEGNWTLKASWDGNDIYQECDSKIVIAVYIEGPKAIVVLGGDKDSRDFDDFNTIANKVYGILTKGRGFRDEDVYYLNPRKNQDGKGVEVDAFTRKDELEHAITVWAAKYVGQHTPLLIYLLSHNTVDHFLLESPGNPDPHLTPNELDVWISKLETTLWDGKHLSPEKPMSIIIIMDACSSGNFLKPLAKELENEKGETVIRRTVITSASVDEPAHIRPADSFSANFFNRVNVDYDVKSAFVDAKDTITVFRGQNPLLDSNGDGIPNKQPDYEKVEGVKIGEPTAAKPPTIENVSFLPPPRKQGKSAVISVDVLAAKIESVTGVLIPPSYDRDQKFEHWSELDKGLIRIEFLPTDDVREYASEPYEFTECGKYILIVHADNPDGDAAPYKTSIKVECKEIVQPLDRQITQWGTVKITMLYQNYPNPFNPDTWIPFQLAGKSDVTLTVYNLQGKIVRHIKLGMVFAGTYLSKDRAIHWNGRAGDGEPVASGMYFYRLQAGDYVAVKRMVMLK